MTLVVLQQRGWVPLHAPTGGCAGEQAAEVDPRRAPGTSSIGPRRGRVRSRCHGCRSQIMDWALPHVGAYLGRGQGACPCGRLPQEADRVAMDAKRRAAGRGARRSCARRRGLASQPVERRRMVRQCRTRQPRASPRSWTSRAARPRDPSCRRPTQETLGRVVKTRRASSRRSRPTLPTHARGAAPRGTSVAGAYGRRTSSP